ncbi:MAG: TfoX/Sxy family protein [Rhizobiaceae bacterium]
MAYDENTASRIRRFLGERADVTEMKMMSGLIFMIGGHMCCAAHGDELIVRVGPEARDSTLEEPHVKPPEIGGGRQPDAFICVESEGHDSDEALAAWINRGLDLIATLPPKG